MKAIQTDNAPKAIGPYSQAIEAGNMLFISGQIPIDPKTGELSKGSISEQTKLVLNNIGGILQAAGYSYKNVVKTTCLLVYGEYFTENPPARSAFAAKDLPKGARIEIEAIAAK